MRNLEMDLYRNETLCDHAKHDHVFAQNLYAALCNMRWKHKEEENSDKLWSCSWRYAGEIISKIREEGDYLDWYCSGIVDAIDNGEGYVQEGVLTPHIVLVLEEMGWTPVKWD
jgi:hypothetical protein